MPLLQNTSSTNKYYLPRPSLSTQPPLAYAHTQLPPAHAHTFCTRLYEHAYLRSTSRLSCQSCRPFLLHPAASTRKLECTPLFAGTTPPFGHTSTSCIHSQYNYLHVFPTQLTHKCRPFNLHPDASIYSWELECPPLTLAGTTPLLRYVYVVHPFAVSTSYAATTASKPAREPIS